MLHAILNKKAGRSLQGQEVHWSSLFSGSEDSLTSSIIGTLFYLPNNLFWSILNKAVGDELFSNEIIEKVQFWPSWGPEGTNNVSRVEPDVFIRTAKFDVIIEAKRWDGGGQNEEQWKNEIIAYENEYTDKNNKMIFIALGGNSSIGKVEITIADEKNAINQRTQTIYRCSWNKLLFYCEDYKKKIKRQKIKVEAPDSCVRILNGVLDYFSVHGFMVFKTFDNLNYPGFLIRFFDRKILKLNISQTIKLQYRFKYLFKNLTLDNVAI